MLRWLIIVATSLCFSTAVASPQAKPKQRPGKRPDVPSGDVRTYQPRQVLEKPIRPITDPAIIAADKTDIASNELVIGVEVNGEARAYPINQLTGPHREIINDVLGGTAIAATW